MEEIKRRRFGPILLLVSVVSASTALIVFVLSENCRSPMPTMGTFGAQILVRNETSSDEMIVAPRRRYAVLSVGTDAKYAYWLPAVVLAWKIRQEFTPIVFLVEDSPGSGWRNHSHTQLIIDLLAEYDIQHVYYLTGDSSLPDNRVRLTQLSRLYASMLPFIRDHDYLITTDVDLLPIATGQGQYYDSFDARLANQTLTSMAWQERQPILLFDLEEFQATDDKWGYNFKEWALSNIGMTGLRWRQILRLPSPISPIAISPEQHICERVNEDIRTTLLNTGNEWFWDQQLVSLRLKTAQITGSIVWERDVLVKYRTNRNRIDRIGWPSSLSAAEIDTKFDSHLPRVPDTRGTYHEIFDMSKWLLQHVLNGDGQGAQHVQRLERFTADFEKAL